MKHLDVLFFFYPNLSTLAFGTPLGRGCGHVVIEKQGRGYTLVIIANGRRMVEKRD